MCVSIPYTITYFYYLWLKLPREFKGPEAYNMAKLNPFYVVNNYES